MKVKCNSRKILADLMTPVSLFLKLREKYSQVLLLESSDYASKTDSLSFLCFDSLSEIEIVDGRLSVNGETEKGDINIVERMASFQASFDIEHDELSSKYNGLVGYSTFDAVQYFENISFDTNKDLGLTPVLRYDFYRFIIVIDHYHNDLYMIENCPESEESQLDSIQQLIDNTDQQTFHFASTSEEYSLLKDDEYMNMVSKAKEHCQRGDVFQLVLARRFQQKFTGDEFNVYRMLRSINPSPYLFYFDYGSYKIFGSSPEAQLKVVDRVAEIHPIAGTFRRTGDINEDQALALKLQNDPKESSEHVMLVDLARNDLSKNCTDVIVKSYKEVQFFSHVIHLVSKVIGTLRENKTAFQVFADTFPAGTLSGAPKYKAMTLIDEYEPHNRSFYGGGVGLLHFNGDLNHAIIIRSFLSKGSTLYYQAGAGLVIDSKEQNELQEVNNKLAALKKAIIQAEKI